MRDASTQTERQIPDADAAPDIVEAFLGAAHRVDIAAWLADLPRRTALEYLSAMGLDERTEVFSFMPLNAQVDFATAIAPSELAQIVTVMDADDRADLFNELDEDLQNRLMRHLAQFEREDIRRLAGYAEATAGAIMTTEYATLRADMTAQQAITELRRAAPEKETIYRSYVLDDGRRLIGSVRLHELILAPAESLIGTIMNDAPVSVRLDSSQEEVANTIARYDLLVLPVLDDEGRLMGIVTHDDAMDAMQEETTEDYQRISSVLPFTESLRDAGIAVLYSRRVVWLVLLIFGNLFSGAGIAYFEETILAYVALVFFLPLLIDSSGNAGSQSATLMVRALATGEVTLHDWRNLILRELMIAGALGATMAIIVYPLGVWRGGYDVALVIALTMFLIVLVGSMVGMSLPFLLSRLKLDPATASGPLVTTIADAAGVIVYFSIATWLLAL